MIRQTNKGKFQVVEDGIDLSRAKCFATLEEAEAYRDRPTPAWVLTEQEKERERQSYRESYAGVLSSPRMRELRADIQEAYGEMCEAGKRAAAAQRAAVRGFGQISCIGRDIGDSRQREADYQASETDGIARSYHAACGKYERELQTAMTEAGIPVGLFRTPII